MAATEEKLAWAFDFPAIEGGTLALGAFQGRVLLVANTASFCGYTHQYAGLEKLHTALAPQGLTVIGVPSQDFNQESPDDATVKAFLRNEVRHRLSAGRPVARARAARGAVLCLGARGSAVGAALELQQGADRSRRPHCRNVRVR